MRTIRIQNGWKMIESRFHAQENTTIHDNINIDSGFCKNDRMNSATSNRTNVSKFRARVVVSSLKPI